VQPTGSHILAFCIVSVYYYLRISHETITNSPRLLLGLLVLQPKSVDHYFVKTIISMMNSVALRRWPALFKNQYKKIRVGYWTLFRKHGHILQILKFKLHWKAIVFLCAFEESVDCHLLSSFCDDSNLYISLFKYVLSTMGVSKESISKWNF